MRRVLCVVIAMAAACTTPNPYQTRTPVVCMPGQYVTSPATGLVEETCGACPSGTFSLSNDVAMCTAWSVCLPGTFVFNVPSATEDRECLGCPDNTFSSQANLNACEMPTACAAGTVLGMQVTATMDQTCDTCGPGNYCAGGTAGEQPCGGDTWDDDANPATMCVMRSDCGPGEYETSDGTNRTDRTCAGCPSGTSSTNTDVKACDAWSDCPTGEYVTNTPSSTVDRTCAQCPDGTTTGQKNESTCIDPATMCDAGTQGTFPACTPCDAGTYCAGGSATAVACAAGTWDHDGNPATACAVQTDCVAGQLVASPGDATHDRTCSPCASGTFSTQLDQASCATWTVCKAPDQFVTHDGSASSDRACGTCADPTFSSTDDSPSCDQACRNTVPSAAIAADPSTASEQDLTLAWTCTYQSCQLAHALDGSKAHVLHATIPADSKQCTTNPTYTYAWKISYQSGIEGGSSICTPSITGATTDTLTLGADSLPDLSSQPAQGQYFVVQLTVDTSAGMTYDQVASFGLLYSNSTLGSASTPACP